MNKKLLVLTVLPALLLSGCGGEKEITAAEAKEVATKMLEKQAQAEPVKEFAAVVNQKQSATVQGSGSAIIESIGAKSSSSASTISFQYSTEKNYLHITEAHSGSSSSGSLSEEWVFVDNGSLYTFVYASGGSGSSRAATKRQLTEKEKAAWDFADLVNLDIYVKNISATLTYALAGIAAGEQEEQPEEEGVKTSLKYFSAGEGNLHLAGEVTYSGAEEAFAGVKGKATGTSKVDAYWENNLPVGYEGSAEVDVKVSESGTEVTVNAKTESSILLQYSGILVAYPDASQYVIKDLDQLSDK